MNISLLGIHAWYAVQMHVQLHRTSLTRETIHVIAVQVHAQIMH